jgi:hypothetical protein
MCGGVGFKIKNIPEAELKKYYSPELIRRFKTADRVESFFWQKNPVLPVKLKSGVEVMEWGNKNEQIKLPLTGWARAESLKAHKWDYLELEIVDLPVDSGYEKKTWFDLPKGVKGIIVKRGKLEKVYMITKEATADYKKQTGHNREPIGEKKNFKKVI